MVPSSTILWIVTLKILKSRRALGPCIFTELRASSSPVITISTLKGPLFTLVRISSWAWVPPPLKRKNAANATTATARMIRFLFLPMTPKFLHTHNPSARRVINNAGYAMERRGIRDDYRMFPPTPDKGRQIPGHYEATGIILVPTV